MRPLLALAALLSAVPAANAAGFFDDYIMGPGGIPPCYARTYTAKHLADHPKQKVTRFYVTHGEYEAAGLPGSFSVSFGFLLKGVRDAYVGIAVCEPKGQGAACTVEGDGGFIALAPRPDGILVSVDGRLEIEGVDSFSPDLWRSDDREFRLYADHPEECLFDVFGENAGPAIEPLTPSIKRPE